MKKPMIGAMISGMILGLAILSSSSTVYAAEEDIVVEINEETFPDTVFRDHILNGFHYIWDENGNQIQVIYDANKDGKLSEGELANIKQLLLAGMGISDLTGIEYFTSLIELNCQRTLISSLDVSTLTELQYLNCYRTMLEGTLDLSKNTKLESVALHANRNLTNVNVSGCTELASVTLDSTGITSIDLSNNPKLASFSCADTALTELDLTNNTELRSLACYNTQLASLDISKNLKLEYLECTETNIASLDTSNNSELSSLLIRATDILGIDVSNNTKLSQMSTPDTIAWLNTGENVGLTVQMVESSISLMVPEDSFDITEMLPGIHTDKITIVSGATIDGAIVSGYENGTPVVYTYDCGTTRDGETILNVTVNLEIKKPEEEPAKPEDSTKLEEDVKPEDSTKPEDSVKPEDSSKTETTTKIPATGDSSTMLIYTILLAISGLYLGCRKYLCK